MSIRAALTRHRGSRPSLGADFVALLRSRGFLKLLGTRLISQLGDGAFTAAIGTYVFFSRSTFPNPAVAATAFAVLYLPYSLVGPFAGVFIDRWSRRQILVWAALLRAALVLVTASLVASGSLGVPLYVSVLAVLGVNRFFLSALSAALPHVVTGDELVIANSLAPTLGTICTFLGAIVELGFHFVGGGGRGGSAVALLAAAACYVLAATVGATMRRDLLGPPQLPAGEQRAGIVSELGAVVRGLVSGAAAAWHRRPVAAALGATAGQRVVYGILLLTAILLYRNYFYSTSAANTSLAHFTLVVIAAAIGFGAAAVITPMVTRRISKAAWITLLLVAGGVLTGGLGPAFAQPAFLVIALLLGVVAQGVAICATTIIQQDMDDGYRGRVFALYDMLFNVPFVLGAVAVAQVIPANGKSALVVEAAAAGYLLSAVGYGLASRRHITAGPGPGAAGQEPGGRPPGGSSSSGAAATAPPAGGRPSDAAQPSSS